MIKIGFATDTNLLKKSAGDLYSSKTVLDSTDIFVEYIEALNKTKPKIELLYFMPELVVEELFSQKKIAFDEQYSVLKNKFMEMNYALDGELPKNNIDEIFEKEKSLYLSKYKNIKLEYTKELFEEIVSEAIQKKAPFDKSKEGKKTDAGFKDTLIWKTILYSNEISACKIFYLFSSDKIFEDSKEYLTKEFTKKHSNTELKIIYLDPDGNQRQNALHKVISDNKLFETDIVKLYNKELILTALNSIKYDYSGDVVYSNDDPVVKLTNILFNEFTDADFVIEDVNELDEKYETVLSFETMKFVLDKELDGINRTLLGKIKIYFKNNKGKMEFDSYKIENVRFYGNYINQLLGTLYSDALRTSIEKLKKSLGIDSKTMNAIKSIKSYYQTKEFYDTLNSIKAITKNINTSYQLEELKKSISNLNITSTAIDVFKKINYDINWIDKKD